METSRHRNVTSLAFIPDGAAQHSEGSLNPTARSVTTLSVAKVIRVGGEMNENIRSTDGIMLIDECKVLG